MISAQLIRYAILGAQTLKKRFESDTELLNLFAFITGQCDTFS